MSQDPRFLHLSNQDPIPLRSLFLKSTLDILRQSSDDDWIRLLDFYSKTFQLKPLAHKTTELVQQPYEAPDRFFKIRHDLILYALAQSDLSFLERILTFPPFLERFGKVALHHPSIEPFMISHLCSLNPSSRLLMTRFLCQSPALRSLGYRGLNPRAANDRLALGTLTRDSESEDSQTQSFYHWLLVDLLKDPQWGDSIHRLHRRLHDSKTRHPLIHSSLEYYELSKLPFPSQTFDFHSIKRI